jgi:hypothetical protein
MTSSGAWTKRSKRLWQQGQKQLGRGISETTVPDCDTKFCAAFQDTAGGWGK